MPYKPPICPAYAQSQCLTLSPIPEAKSKVNSPELSCKSNLFAGFEWTAANALSPLMSQTSPTLQCQLHTEPSECTASATSPAILDKLEQLNLQPQNVAVDSMPGISAILEQPTPITPIATNANLGLGLGFTFLTLPQTPGVESDVEGATPFNTPARPAAPQPIRTSFNLATIEMKLKALGEMPLTPPYDEDMNVNNDITSQTESSVKDREDVHAANDDDNTPLDVWVQYRIEEAKRREEFEQESAEILMSTGTTPDIADAPIDNVSANASLESDVYEDACDLSSPIEEKEINLLNKEVEDAIVITGGKRISVRESCAIATLKRRSRLMGLHKEAGDIAGGETEGLPDEGDGMKVDEFGMKIDDAVKAVIPAGEVEVAMSEDRTSPKYSIFSPTSRLPHRRSVSFAKPEVTHVKTFSSSPLAKKSHKRKASASSLFTLNSSAYGSASTVSGEDDILHITANGPRTVRSFSTGAVPSVLFLTTSLAN